MSQLKYYNSSTSTWDPIIVGAEGPQGETGPAGSTGPQGEAGPSFYAQSTAPSSPSVGTVWVQIP